MDPHLLSLFTACIAGIILLFFCPIDLRVSGSVTAENWAIKVTYWIFSIRVNKKLNFNFMVLDRNLKTFTLSDFNKKGETSAPSKLKSNGKDEGGVHRGPMYLPNLILDMPLGLRSVTISGKVGSDDAAETGKMYGWLSAISRALSFTRVYLMITPDFTEKSFFLKIEAVIRIRSIYHCFKYLISLYNR